MAEFELSDILNYIFAAQDRGERVDPEELPRRFPGCENQLQLIFRMLRMGDRAFGIGKQHAAGEIVADYQLLNRVGQGSNGQVWRAMAVNTRQIVALKLLHPQDTEVFDRTVLARFEAEANALLLLQHANIARVLRPSPVDAAVPFIAMEYLAGTTAETAAESITEFSQRMQLGIRERIELFIPVCRAISYAHRHTIVHRDIKPSNILVTFQDRRPVPKLIDFGLAKRLVSPLYDLTTASLTTNFVGTMLYAAPEQAEYGKNKGFEWRTSPDIYSLGIVLFELLTGKAPYAPDDDNKVSLPTILAQLIDAEELPRMSDKVRAASDAASIAARPNLPSEQLQGLLRDELDWIIDKAVKKSPEERYGSADELADDLENYLNSLPISVGKPSFALRIQKLWRRHRALTLAAATAAIALIVGLIGLSVGLVRATTAEAVAVEQARLAGVAAEEATAAQQKEAAQRELAQSMLQFVEDDLLKLTTVLGQVQALGGDQSTGIHKNATLRDLLDRAAENLRSRQGLAVNARAQLLRLIGVSYRSIGEYNQAEDFLARSINAYQQLPDPDSLESRLEVRTELAFTRVELGKFDQGLGELKTILTERRSRFGTDSKEAMDTLLALGDACYRADQHEQGLAFRREALRICQVALGERSPKYLTCQNRVAESLHSLLKVDEALAEYSRLLPLFAQSFGESSIETMHVQNCIAVAYRDLKKLDQAIPLFRMVTEFREKLLEPNHPLVLQSQENLAIALRDLGEFAESRELLSEVLEVRRDLFPAAHPILISNHGELALCIAMSGNLAAALPMFQEIFDEATIALGADHDETLKAGGNLSMSLIFSNRAAEAFDLLQELLPRHVTRYGLEYGDTVNCLQALSAAAKAADRLDEARTLLIPLMEQAEASAGKESEGAKLLSAIVASLAG